MQSKANRTNSFRLHRVSKANSVKKYSQTLYQLNQSVRIAPTNSVNRSVKYNDLTFVTGHDLNKLRKEPLDDQDGFYQAAHVNLTEVRKRYDDMKKQRVQKDENITKLKEQINKYKIFEGQYSGKINAGKAEVKKLIDDLEDKKKLLEESLMEKKVLLGMQKRLKSDKVVYDQRKFDMEKQHRFQKKQLQVFTKQGHEIGQSSDRTNKIYNKLILELKSEKYERQEHVSNLEAMIEAKQSCLQNNAKREQQIQQIAERALQDKNFDEIQWRNIELTHTFVNKMLKHKIDREMDKFHVVEFAFKQIKTATGVNDAKNLVYKYLNKEQVYGDLLGRITANEKRIANLKDQTEILLQEEKQLEMERQTIQNIKVKEVDISQNLKKLTIVEERNKGIETLKNQMSHWLMKQFKKMSHIEKIHDKFNYPKTNEELKASFQKFIQFLLKSLNKCQVQESKEDKTEAGDLSFRDSARVTRVVPKKSRKNSAGEEIFDVEEEEKNPNIENEQLDLINFQRDELLKNNEKFMKEAKKRQEQKRKLMVEKATEKKEKKAPEVKKEEED